MLWITTRERVWVRMERRGTGKIKTRSSLCPLLDRTKITWTHRMGSCLVLRVAYIVVEIVLLYICRGGPTTIIMRTVCVSLSVCACASACACACACVYSMTKIHLKGRNDHNTHSRKTRAHVKERKKERKKEKDDTATPSQQPAAAYQFSLFLVWFGKSIMLILIIPCAILISGRWGEKR